MEGLARLKPTSMDPFRATIGHEHMPIDMKDLRAGEAQVAQALDSAGYTIAAIMRDWCRNHDLPPPTSRRVSVGISEVANGWTDGVRNIWINRKMLELARSDSGRHRLAALLVHEFLHREPSTATHMHDVEFYHQFHEIAMRTDAIVKGADKIASSLASKEKRAERFAKPDDEELHADVDATELNGQQEALGFGL